MKSAAIFLLPLVSGLAIEARQEHSHGAAAPAAVPSPKAAPKAPSVPKSWPKANPKTPKQAPTPKAATPAPMPAGHSHGAPATPAAPAPMPAGHAHGGGDAGEFGIIKELYDVIKKGGPFDIAKVHKTISLTPSSKYPGAIRQRTLFGPYIVKGAESKSDSGQQIWNEKLREGLCQNCTVLKGRINLFNGDNTPANPKDGVYIHHVLTFNGGKKPDLLTTQSCTNPLQETVYNALGAKFVGVGEDNNNLDVWYTSPGGSAVTGGFHIKTGDVFNVNTDLVSYNPVDREVYLGIEIEYLKGVQGGDSSETLVSTLGCEVTEIKTSDKGPVETVSTKHTFVNNGAIVLSKGHLHSGGISMTININGKDICQSRATYGKDGKSAHVSSFTAQSALENQKLTIPTDHLKHDPLHRQANRNQEGRSNAPQGCL
jgi:hypothetical protein